VETPQAKWANVAPPVPAVLPEQVIFLQAVHSINKIVTNFFVIYIAAEKYV
jgi:hypothetical protein